MPSRSRRPGFSNCCLTILFCLAAVVSVAHAQVTVLQNAPTLGEGVTQQIGGAGFSWYSFVGALRCASTGTAQAIVGVRIRKGTLVDFMQIECAPLERAANGAITWELNQIRVGGSAGNSSGGYAGRFTRCPLGYMISGFKAIYRGSNDYLEDINFECTQITGVGMYKILLRNQAFQIRTGGYTTWASWWAANDAITSYSLRGSQNYAIAKQVASGIDFSPKNQVKAESKCTIGGASALSVAVGSYNSLTGFHQVVQAFQMFCYGGSVDETAADPYKAPFRNGQ